ncbi:MAG: helix-turn-helix transcriptional regulator [Clostridia bacterium]|nr:helix-turn-helix transcriptional regulator [Clostridia bacterium]
MVIGEKIKDLRLSCELTQEELADRCELTKGYISQLENDLTSPSIATLIDILSALGTNLKEFFAEDEQEDKIVFSKNEFIEKKTDEYTLNWLVPNAQKNAMEPIHIVLKAGATTDEDFPHEGEEFGFVIHGEIIIVIGKRKIKVKKGESFYFTSDKVHLIVNRGKVDAEFIWVSSPPSF